MTLEQIAKAHWTNKNAIMAFAEIVRRFLDGTDGAPLGTGAMLKGIGAPYELIHPLALKAGTARDAGLLDGYFDRGGKGAFGKPKVTWHRNTIMQAIEAPAAPVQTLEQFRNSVRARMAHDPRGMAEQEQLWADQDARALDVAEAQQLKQNAPSDDEKWLLEP